MILQGLNKMFPSIKDEFTKRLEVDEDNLVTNTQNHLSDLRKKGRDPGTIQSR